MVFIEMVGGLGMLSIEGLSAECKLRIDCCQSSETADPSLSFIITITIVGCSPSLTLNERIEVVEINAALNFFSHPLLSLIK